MTEPRDTLSDLLTMSETALHDAVDAVATGSLNPHWPAVIAAVAPLWLALAERLGRLPRAEPGEVQAGPGRGGRSSTQAGG